jgi:hypothetical protein
VSTTSQPPAGQSELDSVIEEVALRERVRARYAGLAELAASGATRGWRCSPRPTGCSSPEGASASPTSSPRTT